MQDWRKQLKTRLLEETPQNRAKIIDAFKTDAGGWKRESLALLGVAWPPRKGWRKRLIETGKPR